LKAFSSSVNYTLPTVDRTPTLWITASRGIWAKSPPKQALDRDPTALNADNTHFDLSLKPSPGPFGTHTRGGYPNKGRPTVFTSRIRTNLVAAVAALTFLGSGFIAVALPAAADSAPTLPFAVADTSANTGDCGTIDISTGVNNTSSLVSAMSCFQEAYSTCQTSQLQATWDGATEKTQRLISITPAGGLCMVVDFVTHTDKATGKDSTDTFRCARISSDALGLTVKGCGADGDVRIPTAMTASKGNN
jgi:hypothetical protein